MFTFSEVLVIIALYLKEYKKGEWLIMSLSYEPLWILLDKLNISKMEFARRIDISNATLAKFGKNEPVTLTIIDKICNEFNCNINDVVIHTNDNSELIPQDFLYPGVIVSAQCYPINLSVRRMNEKQRNKASVNYPCIIIAKNKNDSTFFLVAPLNLTRDPETILDIAFSNSIINGVNMHGFVQISKMGIVRSKNFEKILGKLPPLYIADTLTPFVKELSPFLISNNLISESFFDGWFFLQNTDITKSPQD